MKKEQDQPKILNKDEETKQNVEEPKTVLIHHHPNFAQSENIFVQEFKPNMMTQLNLLKFKHALAKKIIKKFNK